MMTGREAIPAIALYQLGQRMIARRLAEEIVKKARREIWATIDFSGKSG
jgi:hypothetical protein